MTETIGKALVVFAAVLPATAAVIGGSWVIVAGHDVGALIVLVGIVLSVLAPVIVGEVV